MGHDDRRLRGWLAAADWSEAAIAAYDEALARDPADAGAWFDLGNLRADVGRWAEACEAYHHATRHEPGFVWAWFNLAQAQQAAGRIEEAVASLERAIALAPAYAEAYVNLALLHERRGAHAAASACWRCYIGLDGDGLWAEEARRHL